MSVQRAKQVSVFSHVDMSKKSCWISNWASNCGSRHWSVLMLTLWVWGGRAGILTFPHRLRSISLSIKGPAPAHSLCHMWTYVKCGKQAPIWLLVSSASLLTERLTFPQICCSQPQWTSAVESPWNSFFSSVWNFSGSSGISSPALKSSPSLNFPVVSGSPVSSSRCLTVPTVES